MTSPEPHATGADARTLKEVLLSISPKYQAFLDLSPLTGREPFPGQTFLADGWAYKDLPPLTLPQFETFVAVVGEGNIKWLAQASSPGGIRGQMLISPIGSDHLAQYLKG